MYIDYENGQELKRKGINEKTHEPELKFSMSEAVYTRRAAKKSMG